MASASHLGTDFIFYVEPKKWSSWTADPSCDFPRFTILKSQTSSFVPPSFPHPELPFSAFEIKGADPKSSIRLTADVIAELTKTRLPQISKANDLLGHVELLIESGRNIQKKIAEGRDPVESVVCELARLGAKTTIETAAKGVIIGGIPLYLSEAGAFPPLAAALPAVAAALPEAMRAAEQIAEAGGDKVDQRCRAYFALARALREEK